MGHYFLLDEFFVLVAVLYMNRVSFSYFLLRAVTAVLNSIQVPWIKNICNCYLPTVVQFLLFFFFLVAPGL